MKKKWSYRLVIFPVEGNRYLAAITHDASENREVLFLIVLASIMEGFAYAEK